MAAMASRRGGSRPRDPFTGRPHSPEEQFRLYFYAAVLALQSGLERLGVAAATRQRFPFLAAYLEELEEVPAEPLASGAGLERWEAASPVRLPLTALKRAAGLDHLAVTLLFLAGLVEEDPRVGALTGELQGTAGQPRPTVGLLTGWWEEPEVRARARRALRGLLAAGLLEVVNPDAPRSEWALQPPALLWDAIRGDLGGAAAPWARFLPPEQLPALDDLVLPEPFHRRLDGLPGLLGSGAAGALVLRGPPSSGRRTTLAAVAAAMGRGVLELAAPDDLGRAGWRLAGPLATLLHAMPVLAMDPAPGETVQVPALPAFDGPVGVTLPVHGGAAGAGLERAVTLIMPALDPAARRRHWEAGLDGHAVEDLDALAERHRMTGGAIRRVAAMAVAEAAVEGRTVVTAGDVRAAGRTIGAALLDTLAARVPAEGSWDDLVVSDPIREELLVLERRCRRRERLREALPPAFGASSGAGVRALFAGPSGTGKSLAARLLAAALGKDLYRLDLSAVVNKYLGETEKNLGRVLGAAESLDIVLLIDEGDALLTRRTDVQTANDRYANLETDYLLHRLESFEGILVVTTNAEQRIDEAFERRLDVVVDFAAPGPLERHAIWTLHLPPDHTVPGPLVRELAARCALTGGQIRNAVLHASLLALDDGQPPGGGHVEAAVRREYRKVGAVCPLRPVAVAHG
jgi:hypothetical protein